MEEARHLFYLNWNGEEWWLYNAAGQRVKAFPGVGIPLTQSTQREARSFVMENIAERDWSIIVTGPEWAPVGESR